MDKNDSKNLLMRTLIDLSMSEQPCDVIFHGEKKPAINVKLDPRVGHALMYGAGPKKMQELLSDIHLSNGQDVSIKDIWWILPMPAEGISKEELDDVDMVLAERRSGPKGETVREMIRDMYKCESDAEVEKYVRRFLAC